MASASSSSAKHLLNESKKRLCTRADSCINNLGSVARQISRGSKSCDILNQAIRNFTQVDIVSDYSAQNLNKMSLILQHVNYHYDTISDSVNHLDYVHEQITSMER